jgi:hypothetical protein
MAVTSTKYKPVQWTIREAAREFGCDAATLSKALTRAGIAPAFEKKLFSTQQIVVALFDDYDSQRTRKITAEADLLEMEKAEKRGELVLVSDLAPKLTQFLSAARQRILSNAKLDDDEKDKIILDLRGCIDCIGGRDAGGDANSAAVSGQ